jgi:hypothetical protein
MVHLSHDQIESEETVMRTIISTQKITDECGATARERLAARHQGSALHQLIHRLPVYTRKELPQLTARIQEAYAVTLC